MLKGRGRGEGRSVTRDWVGLRLCAITHWPRLHAECTIAAMVCAKQARTGEYTHQLSGTLSDSPTPGEP